MNLSEQKIEGKYYWEEKPSWCQPWSIILTGISILIPVFLLLNSLIIQFFAALLIIIWWFLFLFIAPKSYSIYKEMEHKKDL